MSVGYDRHSSSRPISSLSPTRNDSVKTSLVESTVTSSDAFSVVSPGTSHSRSYWSRAWYIGRSKRGAAMIGRIRVSANQSAGSRLPATSRALVAATTVRAGSRRVTRSARVTASVSRTGVDARARAPVPATRPARSARISVTVTRSARSTNAASCLPCGVLIRSSRSWSVRTARTPPPAAPTATGRSMGTSTRPRATPDRFASPNGTPAAGDPHRFGPQRGTGPQHRGAPAPDREAGPDDRTDLHRSPRGPRAPARSPPSPTRPGAAPSRSSSPSRAAGWWPARRRDRRASGRRPRRSRGRRARGRAIRRPTRCAIASPTLNVASGARHTSGVVTAVARPTLRTSTSEARVSVPTTSPGAIRSPCPTATASRPAMAAADSPPIPSSWA